MISKCIDDEVLIEGSMFDFAIDEKTASISISDYTQDALVVNAGGHDFNTVRLSSEAIDVQNEGESA